MRFEQAGTGEALAGVEITWEMLGGRRPAHASAMTDDAAVILLSLPPGEVRFYRGTRPDPEVIPVTVAWGPGEEVIVVELQ